MLLVAGAMLAFTLNTLRTEWIVRDAARANSDQTTDRPGRTPPAWTAGVIDTGVPPRAALNRALVLGRDAWAADDPARRAAQLAAANAYVDIALAARARWGDARVARTYIDFIAWGAADPRTRADFARSYAEAAFLPDSATWRIRFGADQWDALSPAVRQRVVAEAAWFASRSTGNAALVDSIARPGAMRDAIRSALRAPAAQATVS